MTKRTRNNRNLSLAACKLGLDGAKLNINVAQRALAQAGLSKVERTALLSFLCNPVWARSGLKAAGYADAGGACSCGAASDDVFRRLLIFERTEASRESIPSAAELDTLRYR